MINLQYNYAYLDGNNCCVGCKTYSYEVPLNNYIPVPDARNDYIGKYYSFDTDLWYLDAAMTIEADDVNAMYHG